MVPGVAGAARVILGGLGGLGAPVVLTIPTPPRPPNVNCPISNMNPLPRLDPISVVVIGLDGITPRPGTPTKALSAPKATLIALGLKV